MMATTHAFLSLALAVVALPVVGVHAPSVAVLAAAALGGLVPDLDLVTNHRKTLHYPVLFPVCAVGLLVLFGLTGHSALLVGSILVASAGFHALSDILGGGVGYEPWKDDSSHAVYNHLLRRWHVPRRFVRYAGAPEDFLLGAVVAVPVILAPATGPALDAVVVALLLVSAAYAGTRRRFTVIARIVRARTPAALRDRLPSIRFEEG